MSNTMIENGSRIVSMALFVSMMTGCALNSNSHESLNNDQGFPEIEDSWYEGGYFIQPDNVLRIQAGQSKDQVRQLLGNPHYMEGFFGVDEWNYVFNFYTGESQDYITCQYQVQYDEERKVINTRWRDTQCPALLLPIKIEEIAAEPKKEKLTLSGDILFDFDSVELTFEGKLVVDKMTDAILNNFKNPSVTIVGYTDRFGSHNYNLRLSNARAEAISHRMAEHGLNRSNIEISGEGARHPIVECPGENATVSVLECLRPNRRVEIFIEDKVS